MALLIVVANTVAAVAAIILLVRLNGLRSFSKMSSFDFALTVAAGSVLATMMTTTKSPAPELLALLALFLSRYAISLTRQRFPWAERLTDNTPLLLMYEGVVLEKNLALSRITQSDLRAKLREANALSVAQVRAVVLEATGDISVLHGETLDDDLLMGVSWGKEAAPG